MPSLKEYRAALKAAEQAKTEALNMRPGNFSAGKFIAGVTDEGGCALRLCAETEGKTTKVDPERIPNLVAFARWVLKVYGE